VSGTLYTILVYLMGIFAFLITILLGIGFGLPFPSITMATMD